MRRVRGLTLAVLIVSMVLTSLATAQAASPAAKAKPAKWAAQVCTSIDDWVTAVEDAAASAAATPPTSVAEGKKALLKVLGSTIGATKKLLAKIKKAGTPAVEDGATTASILKEQLTAVQSAFTNARTTIKAISVDDPVAFVAQSRTAQDVIESGIEQVAAAIDTGTTNFDDPALVAAFNDEEACASLTA